MGLIANPFETFQHRTRVKPGFQCSYNCQRKLRHIGNTLPAIVAGRRRYIGNTLSAEACGAWKQLSCDLVLQSEFRFFRAYVFEAYGRFAKHSPPPLNAKLFIIFLAMSTLLQYCKLISSFCFMFKSNALVWH